MQLRDGFVVISGCSGGGKSTLLAELKARGHRVVEEPGRRIIAEERVRGGKAFPWVDLVEFLRRAIDMALMDQRAIADDDGWVFFDRGLVDAASALEALTGEPTLRSLCMEYRYHPRVFMAPPWPDIYVTDADRKHDFDAAVVEYDRLLEVFPALGYEVILLPKTLPSLRADFVLDTLANARGAA